jgi:hypothetical protein
MRGANDFPRHGSNFMTVGRIDWLEFVPDDYEEGPFCRDCDGCGWVEGGEYLQTKCKTCGGTGEPKRG